MLARAERGAGSFFGSFLGREMARRSGEGGFSSLFSGWGGLSSDFGGSLVSSTPPWMARSVDEGPSSPAYVAQPWASAFNRRPSPAARAIGGRASRSALAAATGLGVARRPMTAPAPSALPAFGPASFGSPAAGFGSSTVSSASFGSSPASPAGFGSSASFGSFSPGSFEAALPYSAPGSLGLHRSSAGGFTAASARALPSSAATSVQRAALRRSGPLSSTVARVFRGASPAMSSAPAARTTSSAIARASERGSAPFVGGGALASSARGGSPASAWTSSLSRATGPAPSGRGFGLARAARALLAYEAPELTFAAPPAFAAPAAEGSGVWGQTGLTRSVSGPAAIQRQVAAAQAVPGTAAARSLSRSASSPAARAVAQARRSSSVLGAVGQQPLARALSAVDRSAGPAARVLARWTAGDSSPSASGLSRAPQTAVERLARNAGLPGSSSSSAAHFAAAAPGAPFSAWGNAATTGSLGFAARRAAGRAPGAANALSAPGRAFRHAVSPSIAMALAAPPALAASLLPGGAATGRPLTRSARAAASSTSAFATAAAADVGPSSPAATASARAQGGILGLSSTTASGVDTFSPGLSSPSAQASYLPFAGAPSGSSRPSSASAAARYTTGRPDHAPTALQRALAPSGGEVAGGSIARAAARAASPWAAAPAGMPGTRSLGRSAAAPMARRPSWSTATPALSLALPSPVGLASHLTPDATAFGAATSVSPWAAASSASAASAPALARKATSPTARLLQREATGPVATPFLRVGPPAARAAARHGSAASVGGQSLARSLSVAEGLGLSPAVRRFAGSSFDPVFAAPPSLGSPAELGAAVQVRRQAGTEAPSSAQRGTAATATPAAPTAPAAPRSTSLRSPTRHAMERAGSTASQLSPIAEAGVASRAVSRQTRGDGGQPRPMTAPAAGALPAFRSAQLPGAEPAALPGRRAADSSTSTSSSSRAPSASPRRGAAEAPAARRSAAPATSSVATALARATDGTSAESPAPGVRAHSNRGLGFAWRKDVYRSELTIAGLPASLVMPSWDEQAAGSPRARAAAGPGASTTRAAGPASAAPDSTTPSGSASSSPEAPSSRRASRTSSPAARRAAQRSAGATTRSSRVGVPGTLPDAAAAQRRLGDTPEQAFADSVRRSAGPGSAARVPALRRLMEEAPERAAALGYPAFGDSGSLDVAMPARPEVAEADSPKASRSAGSRFVGSRVYRSGRAISAPSSSALPQGGVRRSARGSTRAHRAGPPSSDSIARAPSFQTGEGFPAAEGEVFADASGLVDQAVGRRLARSQDGGAAPSPVTTLSRSGMRELVRKEIAELTTIAAPAPSVHRQVLDAAARLETAQQDTVKRAALPGGGRGAGAKKDLDDFLRRTLRQMLVEERIEQDRDLTPWD